MPVAASDLVQYGAVNWPDTDSATVGGAIATAKRPLDTQWTANAVAAVVSNGADTRQVTIEGRLASGSIDTEVLTLNGTTEVVGTKTWERILRVTLSAADAARTVTLRQGAGGATRHTFNPNETEAAIFFRKSSSGASAKTYFEKSFMRNNNTTSNLLSAQVTLTADPSAKIRIALANTQNDSGTSTNRLTAPSGVTAFVDDGTSISVPGTDLGATSAIGVWAEMQLSASNPALRSTFDIQISGQTA